MIERIAPISYQLLGEEFFKKTLPLFFKEISETENINKENIFYFPLYFKKYKKKLIAEFKTQEFAIELMDFEFSKFSLQNDTSSFQHSMSESLVFLNPLAQALRHEYDIEEFIKTWDKTQSPTAAPKKTLLLLSKNPTTKEILTFKANLTHAAIIDELHDGKMLTEHLISVLKSKNPLISEKEWQDSLNDLKNIFFVF